MGEDKDDDKPDVEVEVPHEADTAEGGGGVSIGRVQVSEQQLPMVAMFMAGLILLIATLVGGKGLENWSYAVSVASVAMFFSLAGFLLTFSQGLNEKVGKFNAYFLFLWCFIGACVLTFDGPFKSTGNGYFASWGLAVASIMGVGVTGSEMKNVIGDMGALVGLGASSIVVIIAIIPEIVDDYYRNQGIYALVVACLTVVIVGIFMTKIGEKCGGFKFATLVFFAILWIVLACIVTFQGPFLVTGNGYFGSWAGAVAAVFAAMAALKED